MVKETMRPKMYFVVPCFNEEEVLPTTIESLLGKLDQLKEDQKISNDSGLFFVDDGSQDETWAIISKAKETNKEIQGISLDHNYGHQIALYAGLLEVKEKCDLTISIDADGQQSLDVVEEMLEEYQKGNEVVCGVRMNRDTDSFFKRCTAGFFYILMKLLGIKVIKNHADYRLVSSRAIRLLEKMEKNTIFLRGEFLELPVKISCVSFECKEREKGESRYSLKKMVELALSGLLMHGNYPIIRIGLMGCLFLITCLLGKVFLVFGVIGILLLGFCLMGLVYDGKGNHTTYNIRMRV